jgi:hypothetical protein
MKEVQMLKINYNFSLLFIALIVITIISCSEEEIVEPTTIPTKVYLEFSDGVVIDEVYDHDCSMLSLSLGSGGLIDSSYYSTGLVVPNALRNSRIILPQIVFYGYDYQMPYKHSYNSVWQYIMDNESNGFNTPPYKMNFFLEYTAEDGTMYANSQNGNIATGWPYATDEGNMQLSKVRFSKTDFHLQCPRDKRRTIRFRAEIEGMLFDRLKTDTITVRGSLDLQIKADND